MLTFISFVGRKKFISDKQQNELLHNTSRFLEMELWRLKVHVRRGNLCTAHAQRAFHFDWLYLMTHVSSGDGKGGVIFLSFDSYFMWCEQLCPRRSFYFDDFYFIEKP